MKKVAVVIPNWNGKVYIGNCLDSLLNQTIKAKIIVVENGSVDGSLEYLKEHFPEVELVINKKNLGFAGGVNSGIKKAIDSDYIALFNNDAVADKNWLKELVKTMDESKKNGIATSKILDKDGKTIDSTGDMFTIWGLPYPRGRGELVSDKYDGKTDIFAGSGGASIYRVSMLKEIGLFDEDFFAYYEDVDISFRAQLAGWKVKYVPYAIAYHQIGATSQKVKGFTTTMSMKNLPWLTLKNVPSKYLYKVLPRLYIALFFFWLRAFTRRQGIDATKGLIISIIKLPKKLLERHKIQSNKKVSDEYIWGIIVHDLPVNATALRKLQYIWQKLMRKQHVNSN
jgi:GT2 family glycosyltransferase